MKDINGEKLKTGDLMAEATGFCNFDMVQCRIVSLWEVPKIKDGRGTVYMHNGKQSYYYWTDPSNSEKLNIDKLPDGFLFAFKHGLQKVEIDKQFMGLEIHEAIKKSDWQKNAITPDILKKMNIASKIKINSFVDIYNQWDLIFSTNRVVPEAVDQIMNLVGYKKCIPKNGEIGIAALYDHSAFMALYSKLSEWKDEGILYEKCKKFDEGV
jgi:hypothetical protein